MRDPRTWVAAASIVAAAVALTTTRGTRESDERPLLRTAILPPPGEEFAGGDGIALSNDGTMLAFAVLRAAPRPRLFVRPLSSDVSREIPGTADASFPFWSPDNRHIGFFAGGELRIVDIDGRATPRPIARVGSPGGGTWAPNGLILYADDPGVIYRVRAGEDPVAVTKREAGVHILPRFLPDGRHFLFSNINPRAVFVGDVRDGSQRQITLGLGATFAAPDHLMLGVNAANEIGRLGSIPFDPVRARITGDRVDLEDSIFNPGGHISFAVSATGVLAFQKVPTNRVRIWLDRHGAPIDSIGRDSAWTYRLSHDGKLVAQGGSVLSVRDLRRGVTPQLPTRSGQRGVVVIWPVWAPDDSSLAFFNTASGAIEVVRADGTAEPVVMSEGLGLQPCDWTSDGRSILATGRTSATNPALALWLVDVDSKNPREKPWLAVSGSISAARLSPNGRWVAYQSDETGVPEVYVRPFPGSGPPVPVSPAGGGVPTWRADGRELYYLTPAGDLDVVSVRTGARFARGTPQLLFRGVTRQPYAPSLTPYDVTPDGQRFLVYTENRAAAPPLTVVAPWQRSLTRR